MRKLAGLTMVCCLLTASLTGCGRENVPEVIEETTVSISRKGQISAWLVGEFEKEYYSLFELTAMAEEEAAEFNRTAGENSGERVSLEKAEELSGNRVAVNYLFDGWQSFTAFNEETLFYGTVEEAARRELFPGAVLKSVGGEALLTEEQLEQKAEKHIIITDVKADIYCPGRAAYLSEGASVNSDGSINTVRAEGLVYILMK